jgi:hypothetical protein
MLTKGYEIRELTIAEALDHLDATREAYKAVRPA